MVQKSFVANEGRVIFSCLPWSEWLFGDGDGLCSGLATWGLIVSSFDVSSTSPTVFSIGSPCHRVA